MFGPLLRPVARPPLDESVPARLRSSHGAHGPWTPAAAWDVDLALIPGGVAVARIGEATVRSPGPAAGR